MEVGGFHATGPAETSGLADDPRDPGLKDHPERRKNNEETPWEDLKRKKKP